MPELETMLTSFTLTRVGLVQMALLSAIFLAGGFTKGAIAFGLPLVTVPLLSNFMPVPVAVAISLPTVLLTNFYQAVFVGHPMATLRRLWPLLLVLCGTLAIASRFLVSLDGSALLPVIGLVAIAFAVTQLVGIKISVPPENERNVSIGVGLFAGILGGVTSLFSTPIITYLASLRMPNDDFVNAMSLLFLCGSLVLGLVLIKESFFGLSELKISVFTLVPLLTGYGLGALLRRMLNQAAFERLVLWALIANGIWLVIKNWLL